MNLPRTLWYDGECLHLIDQTRLPAEVVDRCCHTPADVWEAIKTLRVRGAPAIGVAAAYGVVIGAQQALRSDPNASAITIVRAALATADELATCRPTAVNLFWALDRMRACARASDSTCSAASVIDRLRAEAVAIHEQDEALCRAIGQHGAGLVPDRATLLTHCNAGALATAGMGTALAVIYTAHQAGKQVRVYADETRPLLQGARLTAWELSQSGIPVTVIGDNAAAHVLRDKQVDLVVVGADRIAANGDVANKIGTYGVALLAAAHGVPFYVAAPTTTLDLSLASGSVIPIEERSEAEIAQGFGVRTVPENVQCYNPAFDVTPARLITGIITEHGVARPPYEISLRSMAKARS